MALLRENIWLFCEGIYGSFVTEYMALLTKPMLGAIYTGLFFDRIYGSFAREYRALL